jgi:hypothetical protein
MSELFFINILLELERVAPGFASPLGFNGLRSCQLNLLGGRRRGKLSSVINGNEL